MKGFTDGIKKCYASVIAHVLRRARLVKVLHDTEKPGSRRMPRPPNGIEQLLQHSCHRTAPILEQLIRDACTWAWRFSILQSGQCLPNFIRGEFAIHRRARAGLIPVCNVQAVAAHAVRNMLLPASVKLWIAISKLMVIAQFSSMRCLSRLYCLWRCAPHPSVRVQYNMRYEDYRRTTFVAMHGLHLPPQLFFFRGGNVFAIHSPHRLG
jgi:hypothetical protein